MRLRFLAAAATAALAFPGSTASAQLFPGSRFERAFYFDGCVVTVGCFQATAVTIAYDGFVPNRRPDPTFRNLLWQVNAQFERGVAGVESGLPGRYGITTGAGSSRVTGPDELVVDQCGIQPQQLLPLDGFSCRDGYRISLSEISDLWVSSDWQPTAFTIPIFRGVPGQQPDLATLTRVSVPLVTQSVVPEPATIALVGAGLLVVGGVVRRRKS